MEKFCLSDYFCIFLHPILIYWMMKQQIEISINGRQYTLVDVQTLRELIEDATHRALTKVRLESPELQDNKQDDNFISGINGLAKFLNISPTKAQAIKNSGILPYFQKGRVLRFEKDKVLNALYSSYGNKKSKSND